MSLTQVNFRVVGHRPAMASREFARSMIGKMRLGG
jgi:hypothetical protein